MTITIYYPKVKIYVTHQVLELILLNSTQVQFRCTNGIYYNIELNSNVVVNSIKI